MIDPSLIASSSETVSADPSASDALFLRVEKEAHEGEPPSVLVANAREGKIAGMRTVERAAQGQSR